MFLDYALKTDLHALNVLDAFLQRIFVLAQEPCHHRAVAASATAALAVDNKR